MNTVVFLLLLKFKENYIILLRIFIKNDIRILHCDILFRTIKPIFPYK